MAAKRPLAVVDIDGVVADVRHRLGFLARRPKDWDGFFAAARHDPPHDEGVALVRHLVEDHDVVFLTGRPERLRRDTLAWLARHDLGGHGLVMRPSSDRRPAAVVKLGQLRELAQGREIALVIDDDPVVVQAYRDAGYPTLLADWEDRRAEDDQALRAAQEVEGKT